MEFRSFRPARLSEENLATVGLRIEAPPPPPLRLATRPARIGTLPILAAAVCLAASAIGCSSFSGPRAGITASAADGGIAPAYSPPVVVPPPAAAADPSGFAPAAIAPTLTGAPPPAIAAPTIVRRPDVRPSAGLQLSPGVVVAPLNANVILVAGVYSPERVLMPFQPVDWSLAPGSVGQIVTVGDAPNSSLRSLVSQRPPALAPNAAAGQTFGENLVITRGTPSARNDLTILRGQTWIGLASATEGDTVVTALSPAIADPVTRQQTAVIHWVDIRWIAPPPVAVLPGARQVLTTRVTRQSSGVPLSGWLVRYTVSGGPPAGFAPSGTAEIEIPTDAAGQASAEILQPSPAIGANSITVRLTRPAGPSGEPLVIGTGSTVVNWTNAPPSAVAAPAGLVPPGLIPSLANTPAVMPPPMLQQAPMQPPLPSPISPPVAPSFSPPAIGPPIRVPGPTAAPTPAPPIVGPRPAIPFAPSATRPVVDMQLTGPDRTFVGGQVTFDLLLINRGDVAATGLVLTDRFDDGLVHAAAVNPIQKSLSPLGPHETRRLAIAFKVLKSGRLCNLIELSGDGGLNNSAQACVQSEAAQLIPSPNMPAPVSPPSINPTPITPSPITPAPNSAFTPRPTPAPTRAAANLKLLIASRANPIKAGGETSFQIVVTNQGADPEPKVALSVTIPSVMQFVGAQGQNPSPATIDGQTVRFDPIKQLRPGESLVFEVHVRASGAGKAIVRAEVTSANLPKPLVSETSTSVFTER